MLISSDEGFRHLALGIIREPTNNARLALDIQTLADGLDQEVVQQVMQANPDVIFLDLGVEPSGAGGIQSLSQEVPNAALVVGGPALSAEGLLAVMRAGASEYLPRPFSQTETLEAFQRTVKRRKVKAPGQAPTLGKVTTVFSAKGGTGVTTVATNLAVALRVLTGKEVLLVDLAPGLGTASVAMGVHPRYTYVDVVHNFHRIDEELFLSFLEIDDSGVHVLASPLSPMGVNELSEEEIRSLIGLCRNQFDYVVVDGGSYLSNRLGSVLGLSDERLLVVTPELPTLRNLKQALDLYGRENGKEPPKLVLNQYRDGLGLTSRDIEDGLGHRLTLVLDKDDQRVLQSINVGRPEVSVGKSRIAKKILDLGRKVADAEIAAEPRKGFLSRFRGSGKSGEKTGKKAK